MAKTFKAPYRVGGDKKALKNKLVSNNFNLISDMVWQGIKFTIEDIKSDEPYGNGTPQNKLMRQAWLSKKLHDSFKVFYQLVGYSEEDALKLTDNAIGIVKESTDSSIKEINLRLLGENYFFADAIIKGLKSK